MDEIQGHRNQCKIGKLHTRDIIRILIAHDFYHAGEINHIRALLQRAARWPYE